MIKISDKYLRSLRELDEKYTALAAQTGALDHQLHLFERQKQGLHLQMDQVKQDLGQITRDACLAQGFDPNDPRLILDVKNGVWIVPPTATESVPVPEVPPAKPSIPSISNEMKHEAS